MDPIKSPDDIDSFPDEASNITGSDPFDNNPIEYPEMDDTFGQDPFND